jgi:hypothetical protein
MAGFRAAVIGALQEVILEVAYNGRISKIIKRLFDATPERRRRAFM